MASFGKIARRTLLVGAAVVAGGAAFGYYSYRKPYANPLAEGLGDGQATFNPYVRIATDNRITVIVPRSEMGQGVSTSLAALVAEELDVELDAIKVEHGPVSPAYFNAAALGEAVPFAVFDQGWMAGLARDATDVGGKLFGVQATGGSSSVRDAFDRMRQAGAAARMMLVAAAAKRLGVAPGELSTASGRISHAATNRSLTYGEVALDAAKEDAPAEPPLRDRSQWRLLGKPQKRVDMLDKVTGAPIYGVDVTLPDMLYATVRMSPRFGARPVRSDISRAETVPGVIRIVPIDSDQGHGFGVIAANTWAAFNGADAIDVEWGPASYPVDSVAIAAMLRDKVGSDTGSAFRDDGDVDAAFADAPDEAVIRAEYSGPYLAHACMEPMNTTARLKDGVLDVWSPNQMPSLARWLCADAAAVPQDKVNLVTTSMGGGFGRRLEVDYAVLATILARDTDGRPVKMTWTREEDTRHDVYRPAAVGRLRARIDDDGFPVAVDMRIAAPSVTADTIHRVLPWLPLPLADKIIVDGAWDQPYTIPNYRVSAVQVDVGIPVGSWRSVGASLNGFLHESFLDEVAAAGKVDPVDMRRRLMADFPVALAVVNKVAEMSKWGEPLPAGKARGIAFTLSFGSWVAEVVQVADTPEGVRIERVWIAADVGIAIDPGIIEAQLVSAAIYGLSAAMGQEITFADGMVEQSNFHDFDAMRMHQCPAFEVAILENHPRIGGVGEIGTPPAAPALANAVSALTGKRVRSLPISKQVTFA